jgi:ATP-dependent DNA helicase DinG
MAQAILAAIESRGMLAVEAGTGTGKTFAYLVPALLAGGKVIVSTGTKTLQDQLYGRDIPVVREALGAAASVARLKGRANYVCLYRLERARPASGEEKAWLRRIERFARTSASGDRAGLSDVPEDAPVWALATSTRENCLGQECPYVRECFVLRARREAQEADVVVINHHLFFADLMLREEGVAELLPACNTVILDEAHQLPDTARRFFGESLTSGQLLELARDARMELRAAGGAAPEAEAYAARLERAARELRLVFGAETARLAWSQALAREAFGPALAACGKALGALREALGVQAERSEGLAACARRAGAAAALLARLVESETAEAVRSVEVSAQSVELRATPLSPAAQFCRSLAGPARAWIFASATLALGDDFSHFKRELGIEEARTRAWPSPFDYARQALLYLPPGLPADPNEPEFTAAVVRAALPVLAASRGRAFLLFTSHRALRRAHELLAGRLDLPLLVQGEGSRSALLERFRELGNAVLLGAASFWEGVDVPGEALSVVLIDRLPFAPPDDPVLAARLEALRAEGRNPFLEVQLPQAVLALKQGAGRLIRGERDRGVLVLCDPRLDTRPYGRAIRAALPPMRATREIAEVEAFFRGYHRAGQRPRRSAP